MTQQFYANLKKAYAEVETVFNRFREKYDKGLLDSISSIGTPIEVPEGYQSKKPVIIKGIKTIFPNPRITISLGNGYAMKVRQEEARDFYIARFEPLQNRLQNYIEFDNVLTLRKYGFTSENGFLVPEHKVIGIQLDEGRIKVNTTGYGVTITEDLSEGGDNRVVEFDPEFFTALQNGRQLKSEYERHFEALLDLYTHPKINATVNRHGAPKDPAKSIERMLLVIIKENSGRLAIADLDNLAFDEV